MHNLLSFSTNSLSLLCSGVKMSPSNLTSSDFRDNIRCASSVITVLPTTGCYSSWPPLNLPYLLSNLTPQAQQNLSEPQFQKSTAITTAELLLINVWNEGDLKRRPMLIKCNCLIAKCWEPILRGFQWNYLISSQEVHCRKRQREKRKSGKGKKSNRNGLFSWVSLPMKYSLWFTFG